MKKMMIFSGCFILVLASMVFMSYGEMQKIAISVANLPDLKGNWTGSRRAGPGPHLNTDLEISNDSLPVQGKLIFYAVGRRGTTETVDFTGGRVNDQGNFLITGSQIEVELSLYKDDGKMKLEGNFAWRGDKGTMSLKKR